MNESRFCWQELMCNDPEAAARFYGDLLGWTSEETALGDLNYRFLKNGDELVCGLMSMTETIDLPASWMGYVNVDDVDARTDRVADLGGSVCVPPTDIPMGRFSVINDPKGCCFSLWQDKTGVPPAPKVQPFGAFCWSECLSRDAAVSAEFYAALLGWTVKTMSADGGGAGRSYRLFHHHDKEVGGAMDLPTHAVAAGAGSHWLHYIRVEDVDAKAARTIELGGKVICPGTDIPTVGRFCIIADPQGASVALFREVAK